MSKYAKSITALVTGIIGWGFVVVSSPSGPITATEWLALAVAVATGLGVYGMPNTGPVASIPPAGSPGEGVAKDSVATATNDAMQGIKQPIQGAQ